MPANVQFKRGLLANLPSNIVNGTIYVTTDEHAMYMDYGNQRLRIGDFIPVNTISDLPAAGHAYETAVYYVKTGNILARWDATNSRWIQINKAGVVGVTSSGTGNVITDITTTTNDAGELRLLITKATVATSQDVADLASRVDTLEDKMDDVEDYIEVLEGDSSVEGSLANLAATVQSALLGGEVQYTTLKALGDQLRSLTSTVNSLSGDVTDLQSDVSTLQTTVGQHTTALNTLTGDASVAGSVAAQVAAEAALRSAADTALDTRVDTLEADVSDLGPRVTANEDAITLLNKTDGTVGSVKKTVDDAIAAIVANAPNDFDTLKEISDWISGHADSASAMNSAISTLSGDVSDLQTDVSALETRMTAAEGDIDDLESDVSGLTSSVTTLNGNSSTVGSVDYKIAQAINTVNGDLSDLEDRVAANEDAIETLNGDASTAGSVAKAVADEAALRAAADTALDGRLTTAEGTISGHTTTISTIQSDISDLTTMVNDHEARLTWVEF